MVFDQGRGAGQVRSVMVEVDRVGHRLPLMTQELGSVLRSDDSDRMGGEAVAKNFDRELW